MKHCPLFETFCFVPIDVVMLVPCILICRFSSLSLYLVLFKTDVHLSLTTSALLLIIYFGNNMFCDFILVCFGWNFFFWNFWRKRCFQFSSVFQKIHFCRKLLNLLVWLGSLGRTWMKFILTFHRLECTASFEDSLRLILENQGKFLHTNKRSQRSQYNH